MDRATRAELADRVAHAHRSTWLALGERLGRGWLESHQGFAGGISEVPAEPFNGAVVYGDHDTEELAELIDRVQASGMPYSLLARPGVVEQAAALAARQRLHALPKLPVMVTTTPPAAAPPPGLEIRRLDPSEGDVHVAIAAPAFEAPVEMFAPFVAPQMLDVPGVTVYAGADARGDVTTALTHLRDGGIGIFNVGTLARGRGHGYGGAITAAATRAGFADGAQFAWLQSSPMGFNVYRGLGYEVIEEWDCWYS